MAKIILSGTIEFPLAHLETVRRELPGHIEATRAEAGCVVFEVEEVAGHPGRFSVYEEFVSRAAFELHRQRAANSPWAEVATHATCNYSITESGSD
jgi:quinol monooxygenase YgiN